MVITSIELIDHLGKGLELRSTSGRESQNPQVSKVMVLILDDPD